MLMAPGWLTRPGARIPSLAPASGATWSRRVLWRPTVPHGTVSETAFGAVENPRRGRPRLVGKPAVKAVDRVNAKLAKLLADAENRLAESVLSPTLTAELVEATDNLRGALEPVHVEPDSLTHGEQTEPAAHPPVEPLAITLGRAILAGEDAENSTDNLRARRRRTTPICRSFASTGREKRSGKASSSLKPVSISVMWSRVGVASWA